MTTLALLAVDGWLVVQQGLMQGLGFAALGLAIRFIWFIVSLFKKPVEMPVKPAPVKQPEVSAVDRLAPKES